MLLCLIQWGHSQTINTTTNWPPNVQNDDIALWWWMFLGVFVVEAQPIWMWSAGGSIADRDLEHPIGRLFAWSFWRSARHLHGSQWRYWLFWYTIESRERRWGKFDKTTFIDFLLKTVCMPTVKLWHVRAVRWWRCVVWRGGEMMCSSLH